MLVDVCIRLLYIIMYIILFVNLLPFIYFPFVFQLQMWIYSLGVTLRRTIQSTSANSSHQHSKGVHESGLAMLQRQNTAPGTYQNDVVAQVTAHTNTRQPGLTSLHHQPRQPPHQHQQSNGRVNHAANDNDDSGMITNNVYKHLTSLDYVVRMMCAPNLHYRASLMYLLDVSHLKYIIINIYLTYNRCCSWFVIYKHYM